jgi:hypothetical protein
MTTSTNGILCYGFIINEDVELPWKTDDYDNDFDNWYYTEVVPFKEPFEITSNTDSKIRQEYFSLYYDFKQKNPAPFELVNYCSCDYPMFILAVARIKASRGDPTVINPLELTEYSKEDTKDLKEFAVKYNLIDETDSPSWWLCSYWG